MNSSLCYGWVSHRRLAPRFHGFRYRSGMFYLDLDHFKRINDSLGHPVGDLLLQEVARRIKACVRENDVVARLGGDEFAILQLDVSDPTQSAGLAAKVRDALVLPYSLAGNDVRVSVSIGISSYSPASTSAETKAEARR